MDAISTLAWQVDILIAHDILILQIGVNTTHEQLEYPLVRLGYIYRMACEMCLTFISYSLIKKLPKNENNINF